MTIMRQFVAEQLMAMKGDLHERPLGRLPLYPMIANEGYVPDGTVPDGAVMAMKGDTPNQWREGTPATQPRIDDGGLASNKSLRDDFAGLIITKLAVQPLGSETPEEARTLAAELAYAVADAMIVARKR